nr:hypothetical protein [Pandoravirus massiliensis]
MNPHSIYRIRDGAVYCAAPDDDARLDRMPPEVIAIIVSNLTFAMLTRLLDGPRCLRAAAINDIRRRLHRAGYDDKLLLSEWPAEPHVVARAWVNEHMRSARNDPVDYHYRLAMSGGPCIEYTMDAEPDATAREAVSAARGAIVALRDRRRPDPTQGALPVGDHTWEAISHRRTRAAVDTFLRHAIALAHGDLGPLIIRNLAPDQRRALHMLSNDLGFDHETTGYKGTLRHAYKVPIEFRRRFENGQDGHGESGCDDCYDASNACDPDYKAGRRGWEWSREDRHSWWCCEMGDMAFRYRHAPVKPKATVIVTTRGTIRVPPLAPLPL